MARCANGDGRFAKKGSRLCGSCLANDWKNYFVVLTEVPE